MVRRIIVISLAILIFTTSPGFVVAAESSEAPAATIDEAIAQQILAATLRIIMIAKEQSAGEPANAINRGLGTLINDGDATYIVTHDHWKRLAKKVRAVRLESAAGELLLELTPDRFYSLIRYRDGGTLVMATPLDLTDCLTPVTAVVADEPVQAGQSLAVAFWQPEANEQVTVEPVQVVEGDAGGTSIKLKSVNGKVTVEGNSGGGVFDGAELVGNMWSTIVVRSTDDDGQSSHTSVTDLSRAARYTYDDDAQDELADDIFAAPTKGGAF